jgi:tRNA-2-methylthio-N6-dimethylallyladenosine synthase
VIVQEKQRQIQMRRNANYVGRVEEVMIEGFNKATGQWIGRTSQHKMLNFLGLEMPTHADGENQTAPGGDIISRYMGKYVDVRVTRASPNSLAGEAAGAVRTPASSVQ